MYNLIGFAGTFLILVTYFLVQTGKIGSERLSFSVLNLIGAAGIIVSLIENFNLPVLVLEAAWAVISLYGIYRAIRLKAGSRQPT